MELAPKYTFDDINAEMQFCLMPEKLCVASHQDGFLFCMTLWLNLQLTWIAVLLGSQLWQIARQMTTLEVTSEYQVIRSLNFVLTFIFVDLGRFGFMGGKGTSAADQQGMVNRHRQLLANNPQPIKQTKTTSGTFGFFLQILGLDRFTKGKAGEGLAKASKSNNPFDMGVFENCLDFWTNGKHLNVDWTTLYDIPEEGFKERRKRDKGKGKESDSMIRKPSMTMRMMNFTNRFSGRSNNNYNDNNPYQRVENNEDQV